MQLETKEKMNIIFFPFVNQSLETKYSREGDSSIPFKAFIGIMQAGIYPFCNYKSSVCGCEFQSPQKEFQAVVSLKIKNKKNGI